MKATIVLITISFARFELNLHASAIGSCPTCVSVCAWKTRRYLIIVATVSNFLRFQNVNFGRWPSFLGANSSVKFVL